MYMVWTILLLESFTTSFVDCEIHICHRFENGILLQWHLTIFIAIKVASTALNWNYYVSKNKGVEVVPVLNVIASTLFESVLYEALIRLGLLKWVDDYCEKIEKERSASHVLCP